MLTNPYFVIYSHQNWQLTQKSMCLLMWNLDYPSGRLMVGQSQVIKIYSFFLDFVVTFTMFHTTPNMDVLFLCFGALFLFPKNILVICSLIVPYQVPLHSLLNVDYYAISMADFCLCLIGTISCLHQPHHPSVVTPPTFFSFIVSIGKLQNSTFPSLLLHIFFCHHSSLLLSQTMDYL